MWENFGARVPFLITSLAMFFSAGLAYFKLRLPRSAEQEGEEAGVPETGTR
jgi:hypothetical protein